MDTAAYLERIRYRGPLEPTADTLRQLQVAHLLAVPFENLSIQMREPIVLDDRALFDKIVTRRRGGFCYELNGLFAWLLRSLGFSVTMLAAEVMNARGEWGLPFDHMALLVTLEETWLADVGFGDSFLEPLRMAPGVIQSGLSAVASAKAEPRRTFRIDPVEDRLFVSRRDGEGDWVPQYRFDLRPYSYPDYADMCRYHQTSPDSHFMRQRICSIATPDGRMTISGMRLITTIAGERRERELTSEQDYLEALFANFGIDAAS